MRCKWAGAISGLYGTGSREDLGPGAEAHHVFAPAFELVTSSKGDSAPGKRSITVRQSKEDSSMKSRTWMWTTVVYLFATLGMPVGTAAQDNPSQNHNPKHHQYKLIDRARSEVLPVLLCPWR